MLSKPDYIFRDLSFFSAKDALYSSDALSKHNKTHFRAYMPHNMHSTSKDDLLSCLLGSHLSQMPPLYSPVMFFRWWRFALHEGQLTVVSPDMRRVVVVVEKVLNAPCVRDNVIRIRVAAVTYQVFGRRQFCFYIFLLSSSHSRLGKGPERPRRDQVVMITIW